MWPWPFLLEDEPIRREEDREMVLSKLTARSGGGGLGVMNLPL